MKILLIEDEFILASELSETLEMEGYEVVYVADNGQEALDFYQNNEVDLVLCDINIYGDWDGIQTVEQLIVVKIVPIIYLTAFSNTDTLERAKKTFPAAYILKPYHLTHLRMAIEMAINNFAIKLQPLNLLRDEITKNASNEIILQVNDDIFIKQNYQFVKFPMNDILFLEAESIYTNIVTQNKKYVIRQTITPVLERLPIKHLVRVHRSFAVNINRIDSFNEHKITLGNYQVPLSRTFRDEFMKYFVFR